MASTCPYLARHSHALTLLVPDGISLPRNERPQLVRRHWVAVFVSERMGAVSALAPQPDFEFIVGGVLDALARRSKRNASGGGDGIHHSMLRDCPPIVAAELAAALTAECRQPWMGSKAPVSVLLVIAKKQLPSPLAGFRPICLLPAPYILLTICSSRGSSPTCKAGGATTRSAFDVFARPSRRQRLCTRRSAKVESRVDRSSWPMPTSGRVAASVGGGTFLRQF